MRWLAMLLLAIAPAASAQSTTVDGITVHYAAFAGSDLAAEVAQPLGIVRSDTVVVVGIAVRTGPTGHEQAVPAQVEVRVSDVHGALPAPRMRAVHDRGGDYHLGEVQIDGPTQLAFVVEVSVAGRRTPIRAVFTRDFFPGPPR
jgi:hypothetical protein